MAALIFGTFYGIAVGGPNYQYNNIARLNADGSLDTTFVNARNLWRDPQRLHLSP